MSKGKRTGIYVSSSEKGDRYRGFVPHPLPPRRPLQLTADDDELRQRAERALARLNGLVESLPDASLFIYFTVRQEALAHFYPMLVEVGLPTFAELLLCAADVRLQGAEEIQSYLDAVNHGFKRLRQGLPLSLDLLCELHGMLPADEGETAGTRGQFRRSATLVGGKCVADAVFIPPPPERVMECMVALEKFLREEPAQSPVLVKAALAHAQFVTIHPFHEGNGRMGRLLVTLLLRAEGALDKPVLYLCSYFNRHRQAYYDLLQKIRAEGDWESLLRFILTGVWETAEQNCQIAQEILKLFDRDRRRIEALRGHSATALRVHQYLQASPCASAPTVAQALKLSTRTAAAALTSLERLEIVRSLAGQRSSRLFVYDGYLKILTTQHSI